MGLRYPHCHQMITQIHSTVNKGISAKMEFSKIFQMPLKSLKNEQCHGFWGAHLLGYIHRTATIWVRMGAQVPVLSPNDHPNPSQRR